MSSFRTPPRLRLTTYQKQTLNKHKKWFAASLVISNRFHETTLWYSGDV